MTKQIGYKLNPNKLKKAPQSILPYVCGAFYYTENYEYFDVIKPYLDFPEEHKGIEYYQKELNEKFDKLLVKTKKNFDMSRYSAEYRYNQFCKQQEDDFEYARENGKFREKIRVNYSALKGSEININNAICNSNFVINSVGNSAGYYTMGTIRYYMDKKPNRIVRYFSKLLLNLEWKDK
jgi:hypothetical protein